MQRSWGLLELVAGSGQRWNPRLRVCACVCVSWAVIRTLTLKKNGSPWSAPITQITDLPSMS